MKMIERIKECREFSRRLYNLETIMYREGKLKNKYREGMSKREFKKRLMEDLKHDI